MAKIQADLILNPKLDPSAVSALVTTLNRKYGPGGTIQEAFKADPDRVRKMAKAFGINELFTSNVPPVIGYGGASPPVIGSSGGNIFQRIEKMFSGKGSLLGGFGRYEIGRSAMDAIGLGGGGMGRLGGAALATFGSKFPGLTAAVFSGTTALDALKLVVRSLTGAFEHLLKYAEEGAKLYQQSRALGVGAGQTSGFLKTLGAVGIDEGMAMRLAAYGQFGRSGGSGVGRRSVASTMIGAGRSAGMGPQEIQQLVNMSQEINKAAAELSGAIRQTALVAKQNFETTLEWRVFKEDFKAFWQQIAGIAGPLMSTIIKSLGFSLQMANLFLESQVRMLQFFRTLGEAFGRIVGIMQPAMGALIGLAARSFLPSTDRGHPSRIGGFGRDTHFTALERMGLVIGGHQDRAVQHLQNIDASTRGMLRVLGQALGAIRIGASGGNGNDFTPIHNMP